MKLLNSFFSGQLLALLFFEFPLLMYAVIMSSSLEIQMMMVFIWFISIFGLHGLITIFDNFTILEKHLNPQQSETKKEESNDKPKTEKEIYQEKIHNLLEYIKRTKTILSVNPDGIHHIILTFTDRTTLKIWVANKYFGFASDGEYIGSKGGKTVWKYVYMKENFSKVFDSWIKNFQTEFKLFEEERAEYRIERESGAIPIEDYGFKSGEEK
jgi:hypothetical protein